MTESDPTVEPFTAGRGRAAESRLCWPRGGAALLAGPVEVVMTRGVRRPGGVESLGVESARPLDTMATSGRPSVSGVSPA
ncbi:MAG: hypothetical protein OER95_06800, partial [Acidimicrobiia bacterium]|nr:hypothetical protein [Acidimicrobiia bacterium]